MKSDEKRPIIIKRKKKAHGHHGGAWKIAFADFMTAMMALFLVLWILAISDPEQRKSIAEYFQTPLLVAMSGGERQSASDSVIPGGGPDPTFMEGETRDSDMQPIRDQIERLQLEELMRDIVDAIDASALLRELRDQILIDLIPEGLRIQLVDSDNRPMFDLGRASVAPHMRDLLHIIAPLLNNLPNKIQISGHTDAIAYSGGDSGYSNWELSADRANASRRELISGGLESNKLIRVSGMADGLRFEGAGPNDAINRRIAIIVVDSKAEQAILNQKQYNLLPSQLIDPIPLPALSR